jgi:hypothetical protein
MESEKGVGKLFDADSSIAGMFENCELRFAHCSQD